MSASARSKFAAYREPANRFRKRETAALAGFSTASLSALTVCWQRGLVVRTRFRARARNAAPLGTVTFAGPSSVSEGAIASIRPKLCFTLSCVIFRCRFAIWRSSYSAQHPSPLASSRSASDLATSKWNWAGVPLIRSSNARTAPCSGFSKSARRNPAGARNPFVWQDGSWRDLYISLANHRNSASFDGDAKASKCGDSPPVAAATNAETMTTTPFKPHTFRMAGYGRKLMSAMGRKQTLAFQRVTAPSRTLAERAKQ